MRELFCKPADETLDYVIDFHRALRNGEKIVKASATATEFPAGMVIKTVEFTPDAVTVWLIGGRDKDRHVVQVAIETNLGKVLEREFLVDIHGTAPAYDPVRINAADTRVEIGFLNPYKPSQQLRTDGARIVRKTGETVQLKSINWFGFESTNRVVHGLWAVGYKAVIDQIAALGFNSIRIPFAGDTFSGTRPTGVDFTKPGNTAFQVTGTGKRKDTKRAIVTLKSGSIDIFTAVS